MRQGGGCSGVVDLESVFEHDLPAAEKKSFASARALAVAFNEKGYDPDTRMPGPVRGQLQEAWRYPSNAIHGHTVLEL